MDVITVPSPDCYLREPGETAARRTAARMFAPMERALERHAHEICAVIVEPLVQCAGGMRMYHPVYLTLLREACDRHGVHLIADEIAVGFGRTGTMFACEQAGIAPGLPVPVEGTHRRLPAAVGGARPASACTTPSTTSTRSCEPSCTRTATPATRWPAPRRSPRSTSSRDDDVIARNRALAAHMGAARRAELADHPHVAEVRQQGMILAIELVQDGDRRAAVRRGRERRGLRVYRHALAHGVLLRPIGNVVYFMPPYVITPEEIDLLVGDGARRHRGGDMRLTRVHVPEPLAAAAEVALPEAAAGHVARVLRLRAGAALRAVRRPGGDFHAEITEVAGPARCARASSSASRACASRRCRDAGAGRGARRAHGLDAAEGHRARRAAHPAGARGTQRRAARRAAGRASAAHWQAVVASACEQCGRSVLPVVEPPLELPRYLDGPRRRADGWCCAPDAGTSLAVARGGSRGGLTSVELLIGPEGGLDEAELAATRAGAGFEAVRLGPRCCAPRRPRSRHSRCCRRWRATCARPRDGFRRRSAARGARSPAPAGAR